MTSPCKSSGSYRARCSRGTFVRSASHRSTARAMPLTRDVRRKIELRRFLGRIARRAVVVPDERSPSRGTQTCLSRAHVTSPKMSEGPEWPGCGAHACDNLVDLERSTCRIVLGSPWSRYSFLDVFRTQITLCRVLSCSEQEDVSVTTRGPEVAPPIPMPLRQPRLSMALTVSTRTEAPGSSARELAAVLRRERPRGS
jgi:hypothetical protein